MLCSDCRRNGCSQSYCSTGRKRLPRLDKPGVGLWAPLSSQWPLWSLLKRSDLFLKEIVSLALSFSPRLPPSPLFLASLSVCFCLLPDLPVLQDNKPNPNPISSISLSWFLLRIYSATDSPAPTARTCSKPPDFVSSSTDISALGLCGCLPLFLPTSSSPSQRGPFGLWNIWVSFYCLFCGTGG